MGLYLFLYLLLWLTVLLIWSFFPRLQTHVIYHSFPITDSNGTVTAFYITPQCDYGVMKYVEHIQHKMKYPLTQTFYKSYVCLGLMFVTLLFGVVITYAVRNVPSDFNESRWIAYSIYNWVVIGLIMVCTKFHSVVKIESNLCTIYVIKSVMSGFLLKDPNMIFIIESVQALFTQIGTVCLL
jgi:hypothetical protein